MTKTITINAEEETMISVALEYLASVQEDYCKVEDDIERVESCKRDTAAMRAIVSRIKAARKS